MFSWVNVSIVSSATNKSFDLVGPDSPVSCVACAPSSATTNLNSGSACSISFVTSMFCLSTLITSTDDPIGSVEWSPNGDWLSFSMAPGGGMNQQIYIIRPDGSDLKLLTAPNLVLSILIAKLASLTDHW